MSVCSGIRFCWVESQILCLIMQLCLAYNGAIRAFALLNSFARPAPVQLLLDREPAVAVVELAGQAVHTAGPGATMLFPAPQLPTKHAEQLVPPVPGAHVGATAGIRACTTQ